VTTEYSKGQAFVDPGHGHVHHGSNQTDDPVELVATYLIPKGTTPRIDADEPAACAD
jgi:hypothetical protein